MNWARAIIKELGRTHDAPLIEFGIGLGAAGGFGHFQVFDDLGDHLLHMWDLA
jgi:hypothetical protein